MMIKEINDKQEKKISTSILESLPDWFGIQNQHKYISRSSNLPFFSNT